MMVWDGQVGMWLGILGPDLSDQARASVRSSDQIDELVPAEASFVAAEAAEA